MQCNDIRLHCFRDIKISEIVNKILLAGDEFMPEMDLKQPIFICSACWKSTRKPNQQIGIVL